MIQLLWVVNTVPLKAAKALNLPGAPTGGWVGEMISQLSTHPDIDLHVAARAAISTKLKEKVGGVTYHILPTQGQDVAESDVMATFNEACPDLLHVEGTEFPHATTFLKLWRGQNVVSLQGILHGYEPYQHGDLPILNMLSSGRFTLTALALMYRKSRLFMPRLTNEAETVALAKNLLGRTHWDRAHSYALNPKAPYFVCRRTLRPTFYEGPRWSLDKAAPHRLFVGNTWAPLKGFHWLLHAAAQLRIEFPSITIAAAGGSPYGSGGGGRFSRQIGYPAYLRRLVKDLAMEDCITFTGLLNAGEMADQLRRSHIYVLASTIENSPNTLGEAMAIGTPCVAAYSGGVPDMMEHGREGLVYRADDPKVLAYQIKTIFDEPALAHSLSEAAQKRAMFNHDPRENYRSLLFAYSQILKLPLDKAVFPS